MLFIRKYITLITMVIFFITGCTSTSTSDIQKNIENRKNSEATIIEETPKVNDSSDEVIDSKDEVNVKETIIDEEEEASEYILNLKANEFEDLIELNNDFAGVITIDNLPVDYPVLKARDNEFYLKRDIYKKWNYYGSIFMDYRNFGSGFDKNIIIYGHNMKDDEMFGTLRNYVNQDFAELNTIINFQDLYKTRSYRVFSSYFAESDGDLITTSFTDVSFDDYLNEIKGRSLIDMNIEVTEEDKIITLVTCSYDVDDGRYFVHAVEIESDSSN